MNLIEKELIIEQLCRNVWAVYCESAYGIMIQESKLQYPGVNVICEGISAAGRYNPRFKMVRINAAYYDGSAGTIGTLTETIAHEIAHHICCNLFPQAKQWHGPEFKAVMQSIGYDGNTYHSMSVKKAREIASKAKDELFDL